ncbi:MAG: NosL family protein [Thermodesulfovibrio sp.]|nr:NosL family protein [Thermodesulfovibrio sp.]
MPAQFRSSSRKPTSLCMNRKERKRRDKMKRVLFLLVLLAVCVGPAAKAYAAGNEDIRLHPNCKTCGMSREMFSYSRVLIEYSNGTFSGTCSIRCAAVDLALNMGRGPESIQAGDFNSRQLVDADKAYWVIGGKKEGTMSTRGKWAFRKKEEAAGFIAKNGGTSGTFHDALKASFEDLYSDLKLFWDGLKKHNQE